MIVLNRFIEGYIPNHLSHRDTFDQRGTIVSLDNEQTIAKVMCEVEPESTTGSSSNMGEPKKKVVINYADHIKERSVDEQARSANEAVSDRTQSNISIGYNHAPESDRHFSSTNAEPGKFADWPVLTPSGNQETSLFKDELEANDEQTPMAFEASHSPRATQSSN